MTPQGYFSPLFFFFFTVFVDTLLRELLLILLQGNNLTGQTDRLSFMLCHCFVYISSGTRQFGFVQRSSAAVGCQNISLCREVSHNNFCLSVCVFTALLTAASTGDLSMVKSIHTQTNTNCPAVRSYNRFYRFVCTGIYKASINLASASLSQKKQ